MKPFWLIWRNPRPKPHVILRARVWQLIINGPGYFDTAYDLPEGVTRLGRADENDIVLSGDLVSRKHARLIARGDVLEVEDLGSRNGSKVNGEVLQGVRALQLGDTVSVGENALSIRQPQKIETASSDSLDLAAGGAVKRFGRGSDIDSAVILARDVRDSVVIRVLDNISPLEMGPSPFAELENEKPARYQGESPIAFSWLLLLYKVVEKLASATTLQAFLEDVIDRTMERVGATTAVVLLRHPTGAMVPAAVRHRGVLGQGEVPVSDAVVDAALAKGAAIAVANVRDDARFAERDSVVMYGAGQVLCVPIGQRQPWAGVLYLNRPQREHDEPVEDLLDLTYAVAQLIHTGVQKFQTVQATPTEERLRRALERFHGPDIVERRVQQMRKQGLGVTGLEEKLVTIMSIEVAGLNAMASKLGPDWAVELLSDFYEHTARVIFSFEGTVEKFMGDSAMAVFGVPFSHPDDALRAVRTAKAVHNEWARLMSKRRAGESCELKIGINTGRVLAGIVGGDLRLDFTTIGEPVTVASWLCSSANPGQILITGNTLSAMGARFETTPLGERAPVGSKVRQSVFEVHEEDVGGSTGSGQQKSPDPAPTP